MTNVPHQPRRRQPRRARPETAPARASLPWLTVGTLVMSTALQFVPGDACAAVVTHVSPGAGGAPAGTLTDALLRQRAQQTRAQAPAAPTTYRFQIAPGPLADALKAFEQITGLRTTLGTSTLGTLPSPGASGSLTAEEALRALTRETAVSFRFTAADAVTFELGVSESVEVSANNAPAPSSLKYSEPVRRVPQTVDVIPRTVMDQQGATTLSEVLRNVPGITLQAGEGGGASSTSGDMFNMRGFNASNSLFVDGVRDDGLVARDVYNLEQVEVFLGPTGTDVGRGNAAGYVNMETKTPKLESNLGFSYSLGDGVQNRMTVDANHALPLGDQGQWIHQSAVRVNGLWQDSGTPGRDQATTERRSLAPSLALGLGTPTRVTVGAQIMRQDNLPDYGVPAAAWDRPLTPTTVVATAPVPQSTYYGISAYDYDKVSQDSYTARVEHDITPRLTFLNQTRYNETTREAIISSPGAFTAATQTVAISRQGNERENRILSNQSTFVSRFATGTLRHALTANLEFMHERQFTPTLTGAGTTPAVNIYTPMQVVSGFAPAHSGALSEGETNTAATSFFDTISIGRRWQVNGGMRFEHYETTFLSLNASGVATTDTRGADNLFSGKAGLLYELSPTGNIYVSVGTALTPPGSANFTLSTQEGNQNNPNVDPQRSTNYEVGSKWGFAGDRLLVTSAVFRTENTNVLFVVDSTAIPPVFNLNDGQVAQGATVGVVGQVNPRWQILANIGYVWTEIQTQGANNGRRLQLTPPLSGSLWTTFAVDRRFTVGGGYRYTDPVYVNAANTLEVPSYHVVDALAQYAVHPRLQLRLNVYNVTNERYIRSINNNGARYNPGTPLSALMTTVVMF